MNTRAHVHRERFDVSSERLFALLITPSAIRSWWGAARAIVVPGTGGVWAATWGADEDDPDYTTVATIQVFEPPRRLVLADYRYRAKTPSAPFELDFTTSFTVEPAAGGCELTVEQDGFPCTADGDEFLQRCDQGWRATFAGIRAHLASPRKR